MVELVVFGAVRGAASLQGSVVRYGMLDRMAACAARQGVTVLAFGLGRRQMRLVLEGEGRAVQNVARGLKVGTAAAVRASGADPVTWGETERAPPRDLEAAVVWAHRAPVVAGASGPLASPWSSHRDLLGYRVARFYDAAVLDDRVSAAAVHVRAGGGALGEAGDVAPPGVGLLLRVAASVRGVLPSDRRCFGVFVHLARACGLATHDIASALALTGRRVRQLACAPEPLVAPALVCLGDARLRVVP